MVLILRRKENEKWMVFCFLELSLLFCGEGGDVCRRGWREDISDLYMVTWVLGH